MARLWTRCPPEYAALLRLHYLEGRTLEETAPLCGFASKQTASDAEKRARRRLERGSHRRALRDCLEAFNDFREYQARRAGKPGDIRA